jgi:hypothetical protein
VAAIFFSLSLSFRNTHAFPHVFRVYAQELAVFPQIKKVFSLFPVKIHTICAQRFPTKYFAGRVKPQNAV